MERHVPGKLKQSNKSHATKHRSKGQIKKQFKGKVTVQRSASTKGVLNDLSRSVRRQQAKQIRSNKTAEVLENKKVFGKDGVPKTVALIALAEDADIQGLRSKMAAIATQKVIGGHARPDVLKFKNYPGRLALATSSRNLYSVLDLCKGADLVLFAVTSQEKCIDEFGEQVLRAMKAQSQPTAAAVIVGMDKLPVKERNGRKKLHTSFFDQEFDTCKTLVGDTEQEVTALVRHLMEVSVKPLTFRSNRPYVLACNIESSNKSEETMDLAVSGYLRGRAMNPSGMVHIPGVGDFPISKIISATDPLPATHKPFLLSLEADPLEQDPETERFADDGGFVSDDLEEDFQELQRAENEPHRTKIVPKGTSAYQAEWIVDSDESGDEDVEGMDDEDAEADEIISDSDEEYEELDLTEANKKERMEQMDKKTKKQMERLEETEDIDDSADAVKARKEAELAEDDANFPDMIDTPIDVAARVRFQKYRGFKNFKRGHWDPYEELPVSYSKIHQFANFAHTQKHTTKPIVDETAEKVFPVGHYITVVIKNVPMSFETNYEPGMPLIISGLFKHEAKVTVSHFLMRRQPNDFTHIKSKTPMVVDAGLRRFTVAPIYSTGSFRGDKFKMERWWLPGRHSCASAMTLCTFPPGPVLFFSAGLRNTSPNLIATGSLMGANANRIILKRTILTGFPFKIHKKTAIIRFMFFAPEDITWFKKVELWTKTGLIGHIKSSVGTHGHIKCKFNGHLPSNDTVNLSLYKRVFPKWVEPYADAEAKMVEE